MKKLLKAALIIAAAATFTVALAACDSSGSNRPDNGYVVTFDYNEFNLAEGATSRVRYLGVTADDPYVYVDPSEADKDSAVSFTEYYVYSWHLPQEVSEEGEPARGEDGRVLLGQEWNLKTDRVEGNMTLYANLVDKPSFTVKGGDEDRVFYGMPGETIAYSTVSALAPTKAGHTFYKFYEDENYETEYTGAYSYKEGENKVIYAKFLEGSWSIVTTARAFNTAIGTSSNVYLDADLDFSTTAFQPGRDYNGKLEGNGHKLTGITVTLNISKTSTYGYGLFGVLGAEAEISNLEIEDAKVTFAVDASADLTPKEFGFFAQKAEAGCKLTKVTVSGTLTKGSVAADQAVTYSNFLGEDGGAILENCDYSGVIIPE